MTTNVATLSVIALNIVAPVNNCWLLKWPNNKIYENSIIAMGTLSSINKKKLSMDIILNDFMGH